MSATRIGFLSGSQEYLEARHETLPVVFADVERPLTEVYVELELLRAGALEQDLAGGGRRALAEGFDRERPTLRALLERSPDETSYETGH